MKIPPSLDQILINRLPTDTPLHTGLLLALKLQRTGYPEAVPEFLELHRSFGTPSEYITFWAKLCRWVAHGSCTYLLTPTMQEAFQMTPLDHEILRDVTMNIPYSQMWISLPDSPWYPVGGDAVQPLGVFLEGFDPSRDYSDSPTMWRFDFICQWKLHSEDFGQASPVFVLDREDLRKLQNEETTLDILLFPAIKDLTLDVMESVYLDEIHMGREITGEGVDEVMQEKARQLYLNLSNAFSDMTHRILTLVLNLFLYLNTEKADVTVYRGEEEYQKEKSRLSRVRSSKKRKRAERALSRISRQTVTVIGANYSHKREKASSTTVRPHWRAGHYHKYWRGSKTSAEGSPQRGTHFVRHWVAPIWVGGGEPGETPIYVV